MEPNRLGGINGREASFDGRFLGKDIICRGVGVGVRDKAGEREGKKAHNPPGADGEGEFHQRGRRGRQQGPRTEHSGKSDSNSPISTIVQNPRSLSQFCLLQLPAAYSPPQSSPSLPGPLGGLKPVLTNLPHALECLSTASAPFDRSSRSMI